MTLKTNPIRFPFRPQGPIRTPGSSDDAKQIVRIPDRTAGPAGGIRAQEKPRRLPRPKRRGIRRKSIPFDLKGWIELTRRKDTRSKGRKQDLFSEKDKTNKTNYFNPFRLRHAKTFFI